MRSRRRYRLTDGDFLLLFGFNNNSNQSNNLKV